MSNVKSVKDFFEACKDVSKGFIFAALTDKILCDHWPLKATSEGDYDENLVLELRIFNEDKECKLFRGDIGSEFRHRVIDDSAERDKDYYDEEQYLDIDTTKKPEQKNDGLVTVQATGGGHYNLPLQVEISNDSDNPLKGLERAVLKVRHYISRYEETGKAYVSDWRCVGLYKGKKEAGECKKSWEGGE